MDDIDILLSMVENPTRRRILESLVREPSYPLWCASRAIPSAYRRSWGLASRP